MVSQWRANATPKVTVKTAAIIRVVRKLALAIAERFDRSTSDTSI
jgi:hypothetical protein